MARRKAAFFRQRDQFIFRPQRVVRQLAAAQAGVSEEGADAAFNIDPAVRLRRARLGGQGIKRLFFAEQVFRHRFQHGGTFDKGHGAQCLAPMLNGIATGGRHVQPFAGHFPECFAADGVMNRAFAAPARLPGTGQEAG